MSLDAAAVQARQSFSTNTIPAPLFTTPYPVVYHPTHRYLSTPDDGLLRRGHGLRRHLPREIARRPSLPTAVPRQPQLRRMRKVTAAPSPRLQPFSRRLQPCHQHNTPPTSLLFTQGRPPQVPLPPHGGRRAHQPHGDALLRSGGRAHARRRRARRRARAARAAARRRAARPRPSRRRRAREPGCALPCCLPRPRRASAPSPTTDAYCLLTAYLYLLTYLQAAQRIDLSPPLKRMAHALHAKAQALNPGERSSAAAGRLFGASGGGGASTSTSGAGAAKGPSIAGWWTEIPQCDSKAHRSL